MSGADMDADDGRHDALWIAIEQRRAQPTLDQRDLLRQRLLGDVQASRRRSEAARLGDRDEVAQLPQVRRR